MEGVMNKDLTKTITALFVCLAICVASDSARARRLGPADRSAESGIRLMGTSAGILTGGRTYIVLYWNKEPSATGYNLYRRLKSETGGKPLLVNAGRPISSVTTCDELEKIIERGSPEWETMQKAFSAARAREKTGIPEKKPPAISEKPPLKESAIRTPFLDPARGIGDFRPLFEAVDLCYVFKRGLTAQEEAIFDILANTNLKFRRARGLAFVDDTVTAHEEYVYELKGLDKSGKETTLAFSETIKAGHFILPGPPLNLTATAGDGKVLLLWDRKSEDFSYMVLRAESSTGPYHPVNAQPVVFDIETDLEGTKLESPRPGFVDYQWWNDEGLPITHEVEGRSIDGPKNNRTYYYKVTARDILGRTGAESSYVRATPQDTTPPSAPAAFTISVSPSRPELILTWKKSVRDVKGHQEQDHRHVYRIYRSDKLEDLEYLGVITPESRRKTPLPEPWERLRGLALTRARRVAEIFANPTDPATPELSWRDDSPGLVPEYGEKDFFYRIVCEDAQGNLSAPSAIISGRVPDRNPPGPTRVIDSEGFNDRIKIYWSPNTEPDLAGYQIYRSICDRGSIYHPRVIAIHRTLVKIPDQMEKQLPCDYVLIAEVLLKDGSVELDSAGRAFYEDRSVPEGSPICYSYWVRAFDQARNLYAGDPGNCPRPGESICQKLYENTPPPAPVITGLKAKNNAVLVEWTSSPIQDLRAFHVYRSTEENGVPEFVACVYIDGTPASREPWRGIENPRCADIPAEPNPVSMVVSYSDKAIEPGRVYWYRVSALDWLGNESHGDDLRQIPAISTFTYSKDLPPQPVIQPLSGPPPAGCGRIIRWRPAYDATKLRGFIVFRSTEREGVFRQVSPVIKGNEFKDTLALQGKKYWYRVQAIDLRGKLSEPSEPVQY